LKRVRLHGIVWLTRSSAVVPACGREQPMHRRPLAHSTSALWGPSCKIESRESDRDRGNAGSESEKPYSVSKMGGIIVTIWKTRISIRYADVTFRVLALRPSRAVVLGLFPTKWRYRGNSSFIPVSEACRHCLRRRRLI